MKYSGAMAMNGSPHDHAELRDWQVDELPVAGWVVDGVITHTG